MDSLPFGSPVDDYRRQAAAQLNGWQRGDAVALRFFHAHHPRFRRQDAAWMPAAYSETRLRHETFTEDDARLAVARAGDFLDWTSLVAWVTPIETRDPKIYPFECAVEAVVNGDTDTLRQALADNPGLVHARSTRLTPFDPASHGCQLLHYVAANGVERHRQKTPANAVAIATALLDAGADPNALARLYGGECSALSLLVSSSPPAAAGLQGRLAELLIDRGALVTPLGTGYWTSPLATALVFGFIDTAETLVRKGAAIDSLAVAAALNRLAIVQSRLLVADDDDRHRALALAAQLGHAPVVEVLLAAGVDANRYNPAGMHSHATPLHHAAVGGHLAVVRALLAHGARLDLTDTLYHATPLGWAQHGRHAAVAALLRDAAAPS